MFCIINYVVTLQILCIKAKKKKGTFFLCFTKYKEFSLVFSSLFYSKEVRFYIGMLQQINIMAMLWVKGDGKKGHRRW